MDHPTVRCGDVRVSYLAELDGGGRTFGQAYVEYLRRNVGPVDAFFEWCCGPAFIGFSLLANGLCRRLDLADVNERAVDVVRATIAANDLRDRVDVFHSDGLQQVPESRSWDLVVGNPPHSGTDRPYPAIGKPSLIYMDPGWELHRRFYAEVAGRLRPGGQVIIQENSRFSGPDDVREMIGSGGLAVKRVDDAGRGYYFIWSGRADLTEVGGAAGQQPSLDDHGRRAAAADR